ncbi:uncharacterized protein A4U43_C09F1800 [Asparagus officinalis]|uniref:SET domain-containing protein n=1 Tax=Asparagus officinalis TaxID=4686 RepID=A0A5P1E7V6_ASPOF|nr:uncharacterized protein A4U43_C09F1800 [Asparagus officinalis]
MKVPGLTKYGPRVVARSIKPIKKGEEVCIAYTDLLQPKEMRHCDLWSKYRFVCCCERCSALPEMYVDSILKSDAWSLVTNHDNSKEADCDDLAEFLDQTIAEYMSDGNPEACCKKLENMLCGILEGSPIQEPSKTNFRLHPLHYLSLNAYIALSSACKVLSTNLLATDSNKQSKSRASNVHRASVGYSLLLAGATHHLFMSESSLLANSAVLWFPREAYKCKETSLRFLECISKKLTWSWLYLVRGLYYLENVKSPVDFSWLGLENTCQVTEDWRNAAEFCLCDEYKFETETCIEEYRTLEQVAVCCLAYGKYLATICWGQESYLVHRVGKLFHDIM